MKILTIVGLVMIMLGTAFVAFPNVSPLAIQNYDEYCYVNVSGWEQCSSSIPIGISYKACNYDLYGFRTCVSVPASAITTTSTSLSTVTKTITNIVTSTTTVQGSASISTSTVTEKSLSLSTITKVEISWTTVSTTTTISDGQTIFSSATRTVTITENDSSMSEDPQPSFIALGLLIGGIVIVVVDTKKIDFGD